MQERDNTLYLQNQEKIIELTKLEDDLKESIKVKIKEINSLKGEERKKAIKELDTLKLKIKTQQEEKKLTQQIGNLHENINDNMDKEALLNFDILKHKKGIVKIENQINDLSADTSKSGKEMVKRLRERLKTLNQIGDETTEAATQMQAQQKITDKLLGNLNLSAKALGDMKDQAILFGQAIKSNPYLLLIAGLAAATMALIKMVGFGKRFRDELGTTLGQSKDLAVKLGDNQLYLASIGADAVKITGALTQNFGTLDSVTGKTVTRIAEFEKGLGLAPEHTAKIMKNMESIGGFTQDQALNQIKSIAAMAKANDMIPNDIMADLADNTEFFASYAKDGGDNLAKAAMEARKLGLNLSTTAKIADSLLDFESSIEKEMEAALLTGKQLNYNRARALALEGDVAGAAKEVVKQVGGQAEFNKMNMVQRKALADSIGVSVEEMSKMTSGKPMELKKAKGDPLEGEMNKLEMATANNTSAIIGATTAIVGLGAMKLFGKDGLKGLSKLFGGGGGKNAWNTFQKANKGLSPKDMSTAYQKSKTAVKGGGMFSKLMKGGNLLKAGGTAAKLAKGALGGIGGIVGGLALDYGRTKLDDKDSNLGKSMGIGSSAISGASTGALIGSVLPGPGTLVGGAIGGAIGAAMGTWTEYGDQMKNWWKGKEKSGVDPNGAFKTNNQAAKVQAEIATESAIKLQNKTSDGQTILSQKDIAMREFDDLNDKDKDMYRGMMESGDMTVENLSMMVEGLPTLIADAIRNNPNDVYLIQQKEYLDAMIAAMKENTQAVNNLID